MPTKIFGGGGRVAWNDAGETPNLHFAHFDAGGIPVLTALCNLPAAPGSDKSPPRPGPGSGYIAYCEGGRLEGQRGSAVAFDNQGKEIKKFSGSGGNDLHQQNFIDAVRRRDSKLLMSSAEVGLYSTAWCHLANIACLVGDSLSADQLGQMKTGDNEAQELLGDFEKTLAANKVSAQEQFRISPTLEFDPASEQFVGAHSDEANKLLTRQFRAPFVVPEIAADAVRQAQRS